MAVRARIGFLPEHFRFHDWLTGADLLDFHGRLSDLAASERAARIQAGGFTGSRNVRGRNDDLVRANSLRTSDNRSS